MFIQHAIVRKIAKKTPTRSSEKLYESQRGFRLKIYSTQKREIKPIRLRFKNFKVTKRGGKTFSSRNEVKA